VNYFYYIVDVFTRSAFDGAPLAVFPEAAGLNAAQMQKIAEELNLSESVFISASDNSDEFKLKIFSPVEEKMFGGHAAIAAGFVLGNSEHVDLSTGSVEISLLQKCGPVNTVITREEDGSLFIQFSRSAEAVSDRFVPSNQQLAEMLGLEESDISKSRYNTLLVACEQPYLIVPLSSFDAVRKAEFNFKSWSTSVAPVSPASEILVFSTKSDLVESNFHARLLGPQISLDEDPAIGSSMPVFAAYLSEHDHVKQGTYAYTIDRGTINTRRSILSVELINQKDKENIVRVGGPAIIVSKGSIVSP
jgi:trans-2,3-dihydro-3-hydroxyanthranilate isomerase